MVNKDVLVFKPFEHFRLGGTICSVQQVARHMDDRKHLGLSVEIPKYFSLLRKTFKLGKVKIHIVFKKWRWDSKLGKVFFAAWVSWDNFCLDGPISTSNYEGRHQRTEVGVIDCVLGFVLIAKAERQIQISGAKVQRVALDLGERAGALLVWDQIHWYGSLLGKRHHPN